MENLILRALDNFFQIPNFWIFVVLRNFPFNRFGISVLFVRVCVYMCVWVRFCVWVHRCVHACVHMRRGMSDLGPSIIWLSHTTLLQRILFKSWAETFELLGRISTSELDSQPWHFTKNRIKIPSPDNSLGWTLYPPSTPHITLARAAHLPHPLPKRVRLWGVLWHRTSWRLVGSE